MESPKYRMRLEKVCVAGWGTKRQSLGKARCRLG